MNLPKWLMMVLCAGVFAFAGCGSKKTTPAPTVNGVTVDMPKLRDAFANAGPDLQTDLSEVNMGIRYGDYSRALTALGKLSAAPSLTDAQKKAVNEVTEQVKQLASKTTPAPSP
jgi:hypothetical protein